MLNHKLDILSSDLNSVKELGQEIESQFMERQVQIGSLTEENQLLFDRESQWRDAFNAVSHELSSKLTEINAVRHEMDSLRSALGHLSNELKDWEAKGAEYNRVLDQANVSLEQAQTYIDRLHSALEASGHSINGISRGLVDPDGPINIICHNTSELPDLLPIMEYIDASLN